MENYAYNEAKMLEGILAYQLEFRPAFAETRRGHTRRIRDRKRIERIRSWDRRKINGIVKRVAGEFGLEPMELRCGSHSRRIVFPRQVAMYLLREISDISFPQLGRIFDKHHTTAIYGVESIARRIKSEPDLVKLVETIRGTA